MAERSRAIGKNCNTSLNFLQFEPCDRHTYIIFDFSSFTEFFFQFQGGQGFKSRPEMPIFQQPSAAMPPMPGGLYGGPEYPQGAGELRKVAEIGLN